LRTGAEKNTSVYTLQGKARRWISLRDS